MPFMLKMILSNSKESMSGHKEEFDFTALFANYSHLMWEEEQYWPKLN